MNKPQFCYWLQGYFELTKAMGLEIPNAIPNFYDCILAHIEIIEDTEYNRKIDETLAPLIIEIKFLAKHKLPVSKIQDILHDCFVNIIDKDPLDRVPDKWHSNQTMRC